MLEALHDAKSEQIMAVFCAASWFPQNKKFFLDKAIGRIAFSAILSELLDNLVYPNFLVILTPSAICF
ncbi:hypothetical protein M089_4928 [Bacteroides ovatus str. 3725 D9 iii]|nr:hypothetical protein M082_6410 [Bacteroides fragilis str. 3725 D9 ii]KDS21675.1 hypothetical protein M088_5984 [Bacteroides ovatus str. 3725 D1 iv]KDS23261.1 hypothetical protein M089_4928 [Bacteroides ovatus str. 3725 D9 iii]